jgi:hypothetical protein
MAPKSGPITPEQLTVRPHLAAGKIRAGHLAVC